MSYCVTLDDLSPVRKSRVLIRPSRTPTDYKTSNLPSKPVDMHAVTNPSRSKSALKPNRNGWRSTDDRVGTLTQEGPLRSNFAPLPLRNIKSCVSQHKPIHLVIGYLAFLISLNIIGRWSYRKDFGTGASRNGTSPRTLFTHMVVRNGWAACIDRHLRSPS